MGGLLPLLIISFLLAAVDGEDSLAKLPAEAIANPAEVKAYWGATLPNTPMPQAILDTLAQQDVDKSEKKHASKVDGDGSKMGKILVYNHDQQVDANDSKMGKILIYNHDQQVDGDGSKMGKILVYNHDKQVDGEDSKMGKILVYNHDKQVDGDDSKMGKILVYNHDQQVDGDGSKMGKILVYNHDQQVDRDDSKMGKILVYNHDQQVDGDGSKMGKILIYNHDQQVDGDDSKMGKILVYNHDQQVDGDDSKMGKILVYNHDQQVDGDDSKMGKILVYNHDRQVGGDDSKMGKIFVYNHDKQVDGDDSKMGKILVYNHDKKVDGDGSKMGKILVYNHDEQVDGDDSEITHVHGHNGAQKIDGSQINGVGHKHIHRHGHNHFRLPKGGEFFFFFEKNLAIGSTRRTHIPSTSVNPPFLHHEASKHIPFSRRNITSIINMFAPASLSMIDDISFTLNLCENPEDHQINGKKVGCVTSIESYLELIISTLGTNQVQAFSADVPKEGIASQISTVASVRLLSHSQSVLVCHDMEYPYKVFYCHLSLPTRAYQVKLISQVDGSSVDALAVCHLNTSSWNDDFIFFELMHVKPGQTTACHYLNRGSMVWVANAKLGDNQAAAS
ncbi:unnamed protein product [Urochloa decumbens]|uniref:BURP domain-containing protein n=1 Tax=Urochloa decumbens TaxID=240449 RepID=A0ABC9B836_9POAL